jgi:hypothetical protein
LSQTRVRALTHQIVGYDPRTGEMVFEVDIPRESWETVKSILREDDGDPDYLYIHKLDDGKAADILGIVHANGWRGLDYYIECSSE